jgi:hypothetical protein
MTGTPFTGVTPSLQHTWPDSVPCLTVTWVFASLRSTCGSSLRRHRNVLGDESPGIGRDVDGLDQKAAHGNAAMANFPSPSLVAPSGSDR